MSKEIKILIFTLNGEYYAADIMQVERILGYEVPTSLPEVPSFVDGVINYEESILPVVNLASKFGLQGNKKSEENKIVVVKEKDGKIGIIVDSVYEVRDIESDMIENPPAITTNVSKRYIKGLIKLKDKIIILLDLAKVLTEDEKNQLVHGD